METIPTHTGLMRRSIEPKVSVLIVSRNRLEALIICLDSVLRQNYRSFEILILDNNSSLYHLHELIQAKFNDSRVRCFRSDTSLGVAGGRNFLMQQASGDIFCVIDDDAYFTSNDAISCIVETFSCHSKLGVIALRIMDYRNDCVRLLAPFSQRWRKKYPQLTESPGLVSYYLGGGHAIRRQVVEKCGAYQGDLMFGEEELDLSYRAIQEGFDILYLPGVEVHHHPQPSVMHQENYRQPELYYHVRNRFFIALKYLPWKYIPVYLTIWLTRYGLSAIKSGALKEFLGGIESGIKMLKTLERTPLKPHSIQYLKRHYGRLWY